MNATANPTLSVQGRVDRASLVALVKRRHLTEADADEARGLLEAVLTDLTRSTCRACGATLERGTSEWVDVEEGGTYDICREAAEVDGPHKAANKF